MKRETRAILLCTGKSHKFTILAFIYLNALQIMSYEIINIYLFDLPENCKLVFLFVFIFIRLGLWYFFIII